ncbi:MAG TPA: TMEM165/GDT1 family protein [Oscillatoriales cyanobacterium M59_W2019_021]|nr:MAG: TMEM165/GDT1 family protein [Cyanobacteria bacterium J055]HIK30986.1 TMEM165/GDT1 family protein [Oscillatoriales cyanobacterium M4454_W2019_049]HIK50844.1 TMEM165/GDT1 family protein [Oscillatoriales cyanobacterium M59_W2019_021]
MNVSSPPSEESQPSSSIDSPPPETPTHTEPQPKRLNSGFIAAFTSTFVTILLAEMGDKTQVTTLLMTAQSHAPWVVFLGASTALISTSLVGVLVGRWLARRLSPESLNTAAGVILLLVAIAQFWDLTHL